MCKKLTLGQKFLPFTLQIYKFKGKGKYNAFNRHN